MKNKLKEIDYLKERTVILENEVVTLKRQNKDFVQKIEQLKDRCAEHSEEVTTFVSISATCNASFLDILNK